MVFQSYSHKGTVYYFEVPAEHWLKNPVKRILFKLFPIHLMYEHINQFTEKSLKLLLEHHGIAVYNMKKSGDEISCQGVYGIYEQ